MHGQDTGEKMHVQIEDIRSDQTGWNTEQDILAGLRQPEPVLPTIILYDEAGLKLFEEITYLDEYYLTNAEIDVLGRCADTIVASLGLRDGGVVVELGSGNLRKTELLLEALDKLNLKLTYYALDLDCKELERSIRNIKISLRNVQVCGLYGSYDDARTFLAHLPKNSSKSIWWLGSSIGNFDRSDSAEFVAQFRRVCLSEGDSLLCGMDRRKEPELVQKAYHDIEGVTRRFVLNGLKNVNSILGMPVFQLSAWEYDGIYDPRLGRHEAWYVALKDNKIPQLDGLFFPKGSRIRVERSYKFNDSDTASLWKHAKLRSIGKWVDSKNLYDVHVAHVAPFYFEPSPHQYANQPLPSFSEWKTLWKIWDLITLSMIPKHLLYQKPIDLRHQCVFYLGHIPTFLDIQLSRVTDEEPTEPLYYKVIFERGIDPNVEDPTKCHNHSEVPARWPKLEEILSYRDRVRSRVNAIYQKGQTQELDGSLKRALWLGYEHEAMHAETLLYMLVQSEFTRSPPGFPSPDFAEMAKYAKIFHAVPEEDRWQYIPGCSFNMGLDDAEEQETGDRFFGWDNEKPKRRVATKPMLVSNRPITCGEYYVYLVSKGRLDSPPKSWVALPEGLFVRTVYGPVPLEHVTEWPVVASYDELDAYAQHVGGRIPTATELRLIYDTVNFNSQVQRSNQDVHPKNMVNGYLSANGHSNGLTGRLSQAVAVLDRPLFSDLSQANCGFKHWHYTPMSPAKLAGPAAGGCWEWTSTEFEAWPGYQPSKFYPGYSADFFDGLHNIVLGASWSTVPRIAGRRTFVNWYQRKYGYAAIGARIVKDVVNDEDYCE